MFQILKTCKWNQDKIVYMYFRYTKISDIFCLLQKHHIPHTWTVTEYNQKNLRPTLTCTHTLTWDSENQRISSFKTFHQTDRHQGWEHPPKMAPSYACFLFIMWATPPDPWCDHNKTFKHVLHFYESVASLQVKERASTYFNSIIRPFLIQIFKPQSCFQAQVYNPELQLEPQLGCFQTLYV